MRLRRRQAQAQAPESQSSSTAGRGTSLKKSRASSLGSHSQFVDTCGGLREKSDPFLQSLRHADGAAARDIRCEQRERSSRQTMGAKASQVQGAALGQARIVNEGNHASRHWQHPGLVRTRPAPPVYRDGRKWGDGAFSRSSW